VAQFTPTWLRTTITSGTIPIYCALVIMGFMLVNARLHEGLIAVLKHTTVGAFGLLPKKCSSYIGSVGPQTATFSNDMKNSVQLDGLLFSNDTQVLCVMNDVLDNFAINTEVCGELTVAVDTVTHRRLGTVIVDWNGGHDATRVVRATRRSSPNSNSTIVAIVGEGSETHALLTGTNFMIHRPADLDHATRCMRAAYGTMLQQRLHSKAYRYSCLGFTMLRPLFR
jgi:hypothetical protein